MISRTFRSSRKSFYAAKSRDPSPTPSNSQYSCSSDFDADDESNMSTGEASRPMSLTSPYSLFAARPPTLDEILADEAPAPWSRNAFTAYLSQNHCLETLEFMLDADRYRRHYEQLIKTGLGEASETEAMEASHKMRVMWRKLINAYIAPNGPRELNLSSQVRDPILAQPADLSPPHPSQLDKAVQIIHELLEESVLVPFINSHKPMRVSPTPGTTGHEEKASHNREASNESSHPSSPTFHAPNSLTAGLSRLASRTQKTSSTTHHHSPTSSTSVSGWSVTGTSTSRMTSSAECGMSDDSGEASSAGAKEPMTPPNTPPIGDTLRTAMSLNGSSTAHPGAWRKMTDRLGLSRKRSTVSSSPHDEDYRMPASITSAPEWSVSMPRIEDEHSMVSQHLAAQYQDRHNSDPTDVIL
jgi:hypothetical protein